MEKLSYTKVEDYVNKMNNLNSNMAKCFNQIRSDLNSTQSYWTGNASDNFKKMSSKISLNFEDFSRELKCCQYYIQKCSEEYQELDNKNKEEIKEILEQSKIFNL